MGIRSQGNPVISYKSVWENTAKGATDPPPPPYPEGTGTWIGNRGIYGGGYVPAGATNVIAYIDITSTGNASDFGDLTTGRHAATPASNGTRGVIASGYESIASIDYITIASTGNATDFGDITQGRHNAGGCCDGVRGVFAGGATSPSPTAQSNTIDYITMDTTGDASDFGDLLAGTSGPGGLTNGTWGIFGGGSIGPANAKLNVIQYITVSTAANSVDFGDLTQARVTAQGSGSNDTRGLWAGGSSPSNVDTIDYITMTSTGNASDFGDLVEVVENLGAAFNSTRGTFGGGINHPAYKNVIQYVTIGSTGDATDFGDLTQSVRSPAGFSGAPS